MKSAMLVGDSKKWGSLIHSETIYLGLIYVKPYFNYPAHAHDAEELFHVLSGTAEWYL